MRQTLLFILLGMGVFFSAQSQSLIHYWNFNNSANESALLAPVAALVPGASIVHNSGSNSGGFTSQIQTTSNTAQGFDITNPNARNGDAALTHLRFNNPIGGNLLFSLPTTGYENVMVKYATRRSGSGAHNQVVDYSLDGSTFVNLTTIQPVDGNPTMQTLDFSSIGGANNNPNFKVRISFTQGGGGLEGNNRFDNFTLDATPLATAALIYYWNFNDNSTINNLLTPNVALIGGASINPLVTGTTVIDLNSTGQDFDVENLNARNGDPAGAHLRYNLPIAGEVVCNLPTSNATDIIIKYVARRSGSGAATQTVEYSTDGVTYNPLTTLVITETPTLHTFDLSGIAAVNNNPNFKFRIRFAQGAGGTVGNNRFDNFTVDGKIALIDNQPPVVVFAPVDDAIDIPVSVQPTLTFNRDIRLIDNGAITNENVDDLVELRLNNAAGALVPFDATYNNKVITVVPANPLLNNQVYYVALKANVVEGNNDVAIAEVKAADFTTVSVQTVFNPGDLVPVAYRMNTSNADDEIAFLTFVNILPGTKINFTDGKYTANAQPQCAGGFAFTAPPAGIAANTVIRIVTSPLSTTQGTLTGSNFGLSSSGDQVIVYTGSAAAPSHVTALSSNGWVANATDCGGSLSMIPAGLADGNTALNMSSHPQAVSGNVVNAYYNGPQGGTPATLKAEILNPLNWVTAAGGSPAQDWPIYSFGGAPTVLAASVINQTTLQIVFSEDMNEASVTNTANYSGVPNLTTATRTDNGSLRDTVTLVYSVPFTPGNSYTLMVNGVTDASGVPLAAPYMFQFSYNTTISFKQNFVVTNEASGILNIDFTLSNPSASSVSLVLKPSPWSNAMPISDFTYSTTTLNFTGASNSTQTVSIPIINDVANEMDEYFVLSLENPTGLVVSGNSMATIYIKDDDRKAPETTKEIELEYVSSFKAINPAGSSAEVVAYDMASKRLFITSGVQSRLDIADFTNPAAVTLVKSIDMLPYGSTITSVATMNGIVAAAVPNNNGMANGSVVFFNSNGDFLKQVTVGVLPDMVTFTPDGNKVLTANEGQPNDAYTIDPEGSVSVIDISGGIPGLTQANVTTLGFTAFNANEINLIANGVRKTKATSTLSQDFEPEYITISPDSKKAWVTLQENNSIAEINLETNTIVRIRAQGTKDFNTVFTGLDASDNNGSVLISNWPLKSFYMSDAIGNYSVGGKTYLVTANEGDEKEYGGLNERTTVGAGSTVLDPDMFPHAAMLKQSYNLGRMRITNLNGDTDGDGDFDEIYTVGSRSFSIWDAQTGAQVYDSKDEIELYTSQHPVFGAIFNSDHENNALKGRSRSKGPEPEGLVLATINGQQYAFVALERIGGVMVYNINDPMSAKLVDYKNNRNPVTFGGDLGPETLAYISPETSPDGKAYLVITNEVSGNITIYSVKGAITTPVNLLTFDAKAQTNGTVLLQWATASELNNSHFNIEKSIDGINYTNIAKVNSKGDANIRQDYILTDGKPGIGKIFYRLSQEDKDGKLAYKGVRMVDLGTNLITWTVAPNPVRGNTIKLTNTGTLNKAVQMRLVDVQGRVIWSGMVQPNGGAASINMNKQVAAGMYYLQIIGYNPQAVYIQP